MREDLRCPAFRGLGAGCEYIDRKVDEEMKYSRKPPQSCLRCGNIMRGNGLCPTCSKAMRKKVEKAIKTIRCPLCNGRGFIGVGNALTKDLPRLLQPVGVKQCPRCGGSGEITEIQFGENHDH